MTDLDVLDRLAGRQEGLLTTWEMRAAGLSPAAIRHLANTGRIIRVRPGVYRMAGAPVTRNMILLAAVLAARSKAVISHVSAAHEHAIPGFDAPPQIDLLTTHPDRVRLDGVRGHTTFSLPPSHTTARRGLPLTTVERTLIDVCGHLPGRSFFETADELRRREQLSSGRLAVTMHEVPASGRRRSAIVWRFLHRPEVHPGGSQRELDVLEAIRSAGLPLPVQQWKVRLPTGRSARLDFAYPDVMEALEFLGFDPHGRLLTRFHNDAARTRMLQELGWRLWPVTAWTSTDELLAVVRGIAERIAARGASA